MRIPSLALLLVATIASQVGLAQRTVPFSGGIPLGSQRTRRTASSQAAGGLRHGRGTEDPGRRRHDGARVSLGADVSPRRRHVRHGAGRAAPNHSERKARSSADCRGAGFVLGRRIGSARRRPRLHGRRPSSQVCRERPRVSLVHEAARRQTPDGRDCPRALRRPRAHRRPRHLRVGSRRHVAHRLRARRHALHHDDRHGSAGSQDPGRQGAADSRRWQHSER